MVEQSFWEMLRAKRDSLTKSGAIVADYLVQHAEDAQYLSISSLAKACGVAEATIFRFCRSLGFDGYNEMKIALAKAMATSAPVAKKLEPGVDTQTLTTHAYNTVIDALNGTRSALDPNAVDCAATMLQRARQVFCFGQGGSQALANDIWARFATISTKFHTAGDSHMQAITASLLGPEDVVLFISYSGSTRDMMDTLHLARENGAKVILITHYDDAPGAALADDRYSVQMICDLVHLHRLAIRVCYNAKGYEHCILITDAMSATCMGDGRYKLGALDVIVKNGEARLPEGNLAGSTLTIERAVKNVIEAVHIPAEQALQMASRIPAESIGMDDRGVIAVGKRADLVLLDSDWSVARTIVDGQTVYTK